MLGLQHMAFCKRRERLLQLYADDEMEEGSPDEASEEDMKMDTRRPFLFL